MNKKVTLSLAANRKKIGKYIPKEINQFIDLYLILDDYYAVYSFSNETSDVKNYIDTLSKINIPDPDISFSFFLGKNRSLVRLIRYEDVYTNDELLEHPFSLLSLPSSVDLVPPLSQYYDFKLNCEECGRYTRNQISQLNVENPGLSQILQTNNYEIIVSDDLRELFSSTSLQFEKVISAKNEIYWQLIASDKIKVDTEKTKINTYEICKKCHKPRVVSYFNYSAPLLLSTKQPVINTISKIYCKKPKTANKVDFFLTDQGFGTLGRINRDNKGNLTAQDLENSPSWYFYLPIVTNEFLRILIENGVKGWTATPITLE